MPHSVTGPRASPTLGAWLNPSCPTSFVMSARGTSLFTTCTNVIAKSHSSYTVVTQFLHMPSLRYFAGMCLGMATSGSSIFTPCAYSMHWVPRMQCCQCMMSFAACNIVTACVVSMACNFPLHDNVGVSACNHVLCTVHHGSYSCYKRGSVVHMSY